MFIKTDIRNALKEPKLLNTAITEVFQQIDIDQSGDVDEEELYIFIQKLSLVLSTVIPTKQEVHSIFESLDRNFSEQAFEG